jgi:hypothetical protein
MLQTAVEMVTPPQPPKKAGRKPDLPPGSKTKGVTLAPLDYDFIDDCAYTEDKPMAVLMREILVAWVAEQRAAGRRPNKRPRKSD